jgi:hypothetical protein
VFSKIKWYKTNVKVDGITSEADDDLVEMTPEPVEVELPKYALDDMISLYGSITL